MAQPPHYSADQFPADLLTSLLAAAVTALLSGPAIWFASLCYLRRTYPHHAELWPAATVAGVMDGALLGLGAFVINFALRIWKRERAERKQSDDQLRLALDDLERERQK